MEYKEKKLCTVIISVLLIQFICRYYSKYFVFGNSFQGLIFVLRFAVPILLITAYLKIPWKDLGITVPKISGRGLLWLTGFLLLVPVCLYVIKLNLSYQSYYSQYTRLSGEAYQRFAIFTFSTLFGWEFMHRGFLLFGIRKLMLPDGMKGSTYQFTEQTASVFAVLVVVVFETIYHFAKPDMEAFAMLVGSPVLSLIALKTRSILLPLLIHLYVEVWFIIYIT